MFNVGDKVRCVNPCNRNITKGKIYSVHGKMDDCIEIINDINKISRYSKRKFVNLANAKPIQTNTTDVKMSIDEAAKCLEKGVQIINSELKSKTDYVNHPQHYNKGNIEVIDYIEDKELNFNLGNAIKYISRCNHKGRKKEDLEKAIWYLQREINTKILKL